MNNFNIISPEMIRQNRTLCSLHGGPKNCSGHLQTNYLGFYDENGNKIPDEKIYSSKIYFKHVCDKCGHVIYLPYNLNIPNIIY